MAKWKYERVSNWNGKKGVWGAELNIGILKISVHKHIHHDPNDWLVSCSPFINSKKLDAKTLTEAIKEASEKVKAILENCISSL